MNEIATALHTLLANNIVSFTFRKVNGEIRHAKGTRNLDIARNHTGEYIPNPRGEEQPNSYYDVAVMGWRSYKPENLISIDGVYAREDTDFAKKPTAPNVETKRGELPVREIPVKFHAADGTEKPIGNGKTAPVEIQPVDLPDLDFKPFKPFSEEEIRKAMEELNKDIDIIPLVVNPPYGKVGIPTATEKGIELPLGSVSVDDFARLVARYVVDELGNRLKKITL